MDFKAKKTLENNIDEVLSSVDLFLVRNYITSKQLMKNMSFKEINDLYHVFTPLNSVFDIDALAKEYIFVEGKSLLCISCKKEFSNPYEISQNMECKGEAYHPRINMSKSEKGCLHDSCIKKPKLGNGELPCCHKESSSRGCVSNEGRHVIIFAEDA
jgi:hypothetical protein